MADLSTMYPQTQTLGGFAGGLMQGQQYNDATQNNAINQQRSLQEALYKSQLQPGLVQKSLADVAHTEALTGQAKSQTGLNQQTYDFNERTKDARYTKFIDEAAAAHSKAELEQAQAEIQKGLWSKDPQQQAQAKQLWAMTGDVLKRKMELEMQGQTARDVASIGAAARSAAGGRGKTPKSPRELMSYYDFLANESDDPKEAAKYHQLAQEQEILYQKELILKAQAGLGGKVDLGSVSKSYDVTPMPQPTATARGGINVPPNPATAQRPARQADAAKPKAKEGYIVIYKGGKPVGQVPQAQAELAKQQGYTLE